MRSATPPGTRSCAGLLLCAASAFSLPTLGQPAGKPPVAATAAASSATLSMAQVIDHLGKQGFSDFREIERKGTTHFEVKARDAQRARVELLVDARSGEIVKSKPDR